MPQQPEKQNQKVSTSPTPGLLQRIFGAGSMTPEMEQGVQIARRENPNLAPVEPYGFLSRLLSSGNQAYASPGRTIYVNPDAMQGQSPEDVADTLTHEQTHVNQMAQRGYGPSRELLHEVFGDNTPYHQRPDEMEAYQAEKNRRYSMHRMQTGVPSFLTGQSYAPMDVNLPVERNKGIKTGPTSNKLQQLQGR